MFTPEESFVLPEVLCGRVGKAVGSDWKWLLRYLDIQEAMVRNIEMDTSPASVQEFCTQGLVKWTFLHGNNARVGQLCQALNAVHRSDVCAILMNNMTEH